MKRFIVLASLATFMVALPAAHLSAAAPKKRAFCVTGKNSSSGHVITVPNAVAKRLQSKGIGSTCFKALRDSSECKALNPKLCKKRPPKSPK